MAICPDCAREFYVEGEDDLELGDIVYCEECGAELEVSKLNELELKPVDDDDDEDLEDEGGAVRYEYSQQLNPESSSAMPRGLLLFPTKNFPNLI
jgi:alpha-aminoadipate carrier protein LysW